MHGLVHDLRYALRLFRRDWRFSATLVVTLASGIAATAIVFNVLNNTLLRPLPIPDEHRVFRLTDWTRGPDGQPLRRSTRVHNFLAIRERVRSFDAIVGMRALNFPLEGVGDPLQVYLALVSPGSFELLGVKPIAGRLFTRAEEDAGADAGVVVLSHALWQQQFGGRADAVGQTLRLDGRPHTIVGIVGPDFRFPYQVEGWMPESVREPLEASLATIARLAPGATLEQAQQELDAIGASMENERPDTNRGMRYAMQPLREQLIGDQSRVTWSLFATAALLLVLSCANVANLLLARGARRAREMAVQTAVGAGRWQQVRQLIVESLVYSAAGTAVGLGLAGLAGGTVMNLVPLPLRTQLGLGEVAFDWRVALFASAVTALTALIAGVAPARRLVNNNAIDALRQQSRGSTGPRALMQGLVVGEVALAAMLLLVSGLMADNLSRLSRADLGLRPDGLASIELALPGSRYTTAEQRITFARRLLEATRGVAGVDRAGLVSVNPLDRGSYGAAIESEDRPLAPREAGFIINNRLVSEGWLEAAGVPLLRGRAINSLDDARSQPVAIVSKRLADRFWPGADPLGKRIRLARPNTPWITVVGVAADVRDFGDWRETWYVPFAQHAASAAGATIHLMMRSPLAPDALGTGVRQAMNSVDPRLPVPIPTPMTTMWDAGLEQQQLAASASALFGASGLLLARIGTYGVLAVRGVGTHAGVRHSPRACAARHTLLTDVVRRGTTLAAIGLGIGIGAGLAANRALAAVASESAGTPREVGLLESLSRSA